METNTKKKFTFEFRVSIIYLIIGTLWILFSDLLVLQVASDSYHNYLMSTYKGWVYVVVTSFLLFLLIRKESVKRDMINKELVLATQKATESDKLKTAFLSNISHYIRTPMNSILGFVELLESRNLDQDKREKFLSIIDEQSQELLQLINNIIDAAKIQEGQLQLDETYFSVNELMRKLQFSTESKIYHRKHNVQINLFLELSDEMDQVFADYGKLQIIFSNLLDNAVKFTNSGYIKFGYKVTGNDLECFVSDTGTGISEDKKDVIFINFLHSNHQIQNINEGSSLGLFLCFGLVRSMGGKLWLDSSSKEGTQFKFCFPYKKGKLVVS